VRWVEDPDTRVRFPQDMVRMGSDLLKLRLRRLPRRAQLRAAREGA
jgi:hypothetical protein